MSYYFRTNIKKTLSQRSFNGVHFLVESPDHIPYSIMDPTKISDYVHIGKPFIWSFDLETQAWENYPLLVNPARYTNKFFRVQRGLYI